MNVLRRRLGRRRSPGDGHFLVRADGELHSITEETIARDNRRNSRWGNENMEKLPIFGLASIHNLG